MKKELPGLDHDIEDYFAMQERKTAKGSPPRPLSAPTIDEPKMDITVEESAGEFGPDTIVEKINEFWNR